MIFALGGVVHKRPRVTGRSLVAAGMLLTAGIACCGFSVGRMAALADEPAPYLGRSIDSQISSAIRARHCHLRVTLIRSRDLCR
jgi:hypothetical protein